MKYSFRFISHTGEAGLLCEVEAADFNAAAGQLHSGIALAAAGDGMWYLTTDLEKKPATDQR